MALSVNDLQRMGYTVAVPATAMVDGPCRVMGMQVRATGAAVALLSIWNSTATSGTASLTLSTPAADGESAVAWYGPNGVKFATGLAGSVATGLAYIFYVVE